MESPTFSSDANWVTDSNHRLLLQPVLEQYDGFGAELVVRISHRMVHVMTGAQALVATADRCHLEQVDVAGLRQLVAAGQLHPLDDVHESLRAAVDDARLLQDLDSIDNERVRGLRQLNLGLGVPGIEQILEGCEGTLGGQVAAVARHADHGPLHRIWDGILHLRAGPGDAAGQLVDGQGLGIAGILDFLGEGDEEVT